MPLSLATGAPTLFIRRVAYERTNLERAAIDERLGLTADEFRVEGDLVAIGPVYDVKAFDELLRDLEDLGLEPFEDFFDLGGNWPEWLHLHASAPGAGGRAG